MRQIIDEVIRLYGGVSIMNHKLKEMGFDAVTTAGSNFAVMIDQYGVITFNTKLRDSLELKKWENGALYFNSNEGMLGIHVGNFDKRRDKDLPVVTISNATISAKEELRSIQDNHPQYRMIPDQGKDNNRFEGVEIENMDKGSRMILVEIPNSKKRF